MGAAAMNRRPWLVAWAAGSEWRNRPTSGRFCVFPSAPGSPSRPATASGWGGKDFDVRELGRRGFAVLGLFAVLVGLTATPAGASPVWCAKDPVVEIGGKRVHVYVSSHEEILTTVSGPTEVRITVPVGVSTELISTDEGFAGQGYEVEFAESENLDATDMGVQIRVSVRVPAAVELPVKVKVTDGDDNRLNGDIGTTNAWVRLGARL